MTLHERLQDRLEPHPSGCLLFTGRVDRNGYGRISAGGQDAGAHRVAYELFVGPIPDGMTIDHVCHNEDAECNEGDACVHRRCCKPTHLVPVSRRVNIFSGRTLAAQRAAMTHCARGHEFTPENTYRRPSNGNRLCRECARFKRSRNRTAA